MSHLTIRNPNNTKLAVVYVGRESTDYVKKGDVLTYLSILTGTPLPVLTEHYILQKGIKPSGTTAATGDLRSGHHVIFPKSPSHPQLQPVGGPSPTLFPPKKPSSKPPSQTDLTTAVGALSLEDATREDESDPTPEEVQRYAMFTLSLALRDRRCVVTGNAHPNLLVGAHIIPHSWKRRQYIGLPQEITEVLSLGYEEMGVNDFRNGALMDSAVHTAFGLQYWSVVWEDTTKKWRVVAMSKEVPAGLVGKYLLSPDPGVAADGGSYEDSFINPEFLEYHFKTAVLRRMKGGGEIDDLGDKPTQDVIKVWSDDQTFARYVASGGDWSEAVE
ncbi:uncharacterized protein EV422DRAFT_510734 [Fimicolochytrium jonesii]|uniref:uncharacterized protein n=1 Tax=Fimicolochytrium jonesii TaxID=1396493 RepID=UPI0022FF35A5|nr:uncharacterized protein EV422DRAFT_510734 [Fimicolochytrium jonesii]KAI8826587.1 hypothetical protein EV422DRAFT_510734 [Fimicolochytrium jonesii]